MRLALFCLCSLLASNAWADCPPASHDRAALEALKANAFELPADARPALARALVDCLGDPDPAMRDGIAYEALAHWFRYGALPVERRLEVFDALLAQLRRAEDAQGFRRPFAALVLSEAAASDVSKPWLDGPRRTVLLDAAVDFVEGVSDYRGFDEREGWRHGVAHGADLLLHLARQDAFGRAELDRVRAAVASQVAPADGHAYVDGESERLARALLYVALRQQHDAADWERWLVELAGPGSLSTWDAAFTTRAGLARRHNLLAFLRATYEGAREAGDAKLEAALLPGLRAAFKAVP